MKNKELQFISEFKSRPDNQKPREKLVEHGPSSLQFWELIALILRTGEKYKGGGFEDVEQLSKRLLAEGGFKGLFTQGEVTKTQETFGIYKSHAEMIVAIAEICRRIHGKYEAFDASSPEKVFKQFQHLQSAKQEQCHLLLINSKRQCLQQEMIAMGGSNNVVVSPSDILRLPIWLGAQEIMIVHNHPGNAEASEEDIKWTLGLAHGASSFHQIKVRDHIIVGQNGYFSFLEKGLL